ncbi:MAG: prepilin-type N-terminal cleavage/methylation domain-containing protein, partial [Sedimentisphaerales bacterium]|nr:prepilin-type N-terminal cleavage/methylation domain-containing protein [Sedimentisphaerales bacterium]
MRQFGFTIVELLVVIAILAVIMALLFPALNTARLHTRALVCSSNIKQILSFLTIYEQQNGAFPYGFDDSMLFSAAPTEYYPGNVTYGDKRGKWWFQQLDDMFNTECKDDRILWCPSRCVKDPTSKRNILCGNYGVNRSICKDADGITGMLGSKYVGKPLSISKIPSPSNAILVIDSGYSLISWEVATDTIINGPEIPRPDSFY